MRWFIVAGVLTLLIVAVLTQVTAAEESDPSENARAEFKTPQTTAHSKSPTNVYLLWVAFDLVDKCANKDTPGCISKDDLSCALGFQGADLDAAYAEVDRNGNECVTMEEFLWLLKRNKVIQPKFLRHFDTEGDYCAAFKFFDEVLGVAADHLVTLEEIVVGLQNLQQKVNLDIDEDLAAVVFYLLDVYGYDPDQPDITGHDGYLNYLEFRSIFRDPADLQGLTDVSCYTDYVQLPARYKVVG